MATIAHLPAAFGIKRRFGQYNLHLVFAFRFYQPVFYHSGLSPKLLITYKTVGDIFLQHHPIAGFYVGGGTAAVFLLQHGFVETSFVNGFFVFRGNQLG